VREGTLFGVCFEAVDHRALALYVAHSLRTMAFYPQLTHDNPSSS